MMKQNFNTKFLLMGLACISLASCSDDDSDNKPSTGTPMATNLTVNLNGLEDLGADHLYEGWILVNGSPLSTGTFSVNSNGNLSKSSFTVDQAMLDSATKFILTVEPSPDTDPAPSAQKLIAGDFSGSSAALTTATAPAIGDFSMATGSYFLRTPTDESGMNNGNDTNGVWFGVPGMPPTSGFTNLPDLNGTGWTYEGWLVTANGAISTGTFTDFEAMDSGNPLSGTLNNAGPPIPGEDFFNAPMGSMDTYPIDVRGKTLVISVEPVPDNSPAPFLLKPLLSNISSTAATAPTMHSFGQNLGSLPTGTVSR